MVTDFHQTELSWLKDMQAFLKGPILDLFFFLWNFVDTFSFSMILITVVWHLFSKKKGIKLFYIIILSAAINHFLKELFSLARPCHIDPSVGMLCLPSYGLPSNAAQSAVLLCSVIFVESRKNLYRILGIIFALLLCLSRLYLGVHFISDVAAGMIVGALMGYIYLKWFPILEKNWKKSFVLFPVVLFLLGGLHTPLLLSFVLGAEAGLIALGKKKEEKRPFILKLYKTIFIFMGLFLLSKGAELSNPLRLIFGFVMGIWLSYLGEWTAKLIYFSFRKKAT